MINQRMPSPLRRLENAQTAGLRAVRVQRPGALPYGRMHRIAENRLHVGSSVRGAFHRMSFLSMIVRRIGTL